MATTRAFRLPAARAPKTPRRALPVALISLGLVALLILSASPARVHAESVFGALRSPGQAALIAGHRGDRSVAPENTLPALQGALDSTLDFVETDIQLSADGIPVLIHDETVDRTTDGTGAVADLTFSQLRALDAGSWYSPAFAGVVVPSLDEFLAIFASSSKQALLELKGFWTEDEIRLVVGKVAASGAKHRVTFASFDFTTIVNLRSVAPEIPRVVIQKLLPADPVGLAEYFGAIAILTSPRALEASPNAVAEMHEAGLGLLLYTLNSKQRWSEALALGVDGIVTDKPSNLDEWLAETAPGT
jgi:glycerophosphoryl diester phosphodiesterase